MVGVLFGEGILRELGQWPSGFDQGLGAGVPVCPEFLPGHLGHGSVLEDERDLVLLVRGVGLEGGVDGFSVGVGGSLQGGRAVPAVLPGDSFLPRSVGGDVGDPVMVFQDLAVGNLGSCGCHGHGCFSFYYSEGGAKGRGTAPPSLRAL